MKRVGGGEGGKGECLMRMADITQYGGGGGTFYSIVWYGMACIVLYVLYTVVWIIVLGHRKIIIIIIKIITIKENR